MYLCSGLTLSGFLRVLHFWPQFFGLVYLPTVMWNTKIHFGGNLPLMLMCPRSLRASFVISVIFLGIGLHSILNKRGAIKQNQVISNTVRDIIAQSPSTEAQLDLLGDKSFLVSEDNIAYLAYCDTGGSLITRGEPIGDETSGKNLMWQLRELADRSGKRCAFYAVSSKYMETYLDLGLSILKNRGNCSGKSERVYTGWTEEKKAFAMRTTRPHGTVMNLVL